MDYQQFLTRVIDDGIEAANRDYAHDDHKRHGAVEGFEACRGKSPRELSELLKTAASNTSLAIEDRVDDYWRLRCYELEVGWVCNVVSASLMNQGLPTIVTPTARGVMKAASIVGVSQVS